jgi:hypothetical protein
LQELCARSKLILASQAASEAPATPMITVGLALAP